MKHIQTSFRISLISIFISLSLYSSEAKASLVSIVKAQLQKQIESGQVFEALQKASSMNIDLKSSAKQKIQQLVQNETLNVFDTITKAQQYGIDLKEEVYIKEQIKKDVKEHKYEAPYAIQQGETVGLDLKNDFFPAYWGAFLEFLKQKDYGDLLIALESFSKNTLPNEGKQVFEDIGEAPCDGKVTSHWLKQTFDRVFEGEGKYATQDLPKREFTNLIKAVEVFEKFHHIDQNICETIYQRLQQSEFEISLEEAYKRYIGPQTCEGTDISNGVVREVIDRRVSLQDAFNIQAILVRQHKYHTDLEIPDNKAREIAQDVTTGNISLKQAFLDRLKEMECDGENIKPQVVEALLRGEKLSSALRLEKIVHREEVIKSLNLNIPEEVITRTAKKMTDEEKDQRKSLIEALGNIECKKGNTIEGIITNLIVQELLDNHKIYPQAIQSARITQRKNNLMRLGIEEAIAENAAQHITNNHSENYKGCLTQALNQFLPVLAYERQDMKVRVIELFIEENRNYDQAIKQAQKEILSQIYQTKGLREEQAEEIARKIVEETKDKKNALREVLQDLPRYDGYSILETVLTQIEDKNQNLENALKRAKKIKEEEILKDLNLGLELLPLQTMIMAIVDHNQSRLQALTGRIATVERYGTHLKEDVAQHMLENHVNFAMAKEAVETGFLKRFLQERIRDIEENKALLWAQAVYAGKEEVQALQEVLGEQRYKNREVSLQIAQEAWNTKASLEKCLKNQKIEIESEEITRDYPKLQDSSIELARYIVTESLSIEEGLKGYLKAHKNFRYNPTKINSAVQSILQDKDSLTEAWEKISLNPLIEQLKKLSQIEEPIRQEIAKKMALNESLKIEETLVAYLEETQPKEEKLFETQWNSVAEKMLRDTSFEDANKCVSIEYFSKYLENEGWSFLNVPQVAEFIFTLKQPVEESLNFYILSTLKDAPNDLNQHEFIDFLKKYPQKDFSQALKDYYKVTFSKMSLALQKDSMGEKLALEMVRFKIEEKAIGTPEVLLAEALISQGIINKGIKSIHAQEQALDIAKILLEGKVDNIEQALQIHNIRLTKNQLEFDYPHLDEGSCFNLARLMVEGNIAKEDALQAIFFERKKIDGSEISEAIQFVFLQKHTFDQAENECGFGPIAKRYPHLEKETAKIIARKIRKELQDIQKGEIIDQAIRSYLEKSLGLSEDLSGKVLHYLGTSDENLFECIEKANQIQEKINILKFEQYFEEVSQNARDPELRRLIKGDQVGNLTEQEAHQFLWAVCEHALEAGDIDNFKVGLARYLKNKNCQPTIAFVREHPELQEEYFLQVAHHIFPEFGVPGTLAQALTLTSDNLTSQESEHVFKKSVYQHVKNAEAPRGVDIGEAVTPLWQKIFENTDLLPLLSIAYFSEKWDGQNVESLLPLLSRVIKKYFILTQHEFVCNERHLDEKYFEPMVEAAVKHMIKTEVKFAPAVAGVEKNLRDTHYTPHKNKMAFLPEEPLWTLALDKGLLKRERTEEGADFLENLIRGVFKQDQPQQAILSYLRNDRFKNRELPMGSEEDYRNALSVQLPFLADQEACETFLLALQKFNTWLGQKAEDFGKTILLDPVDLTEVTWNHMVRTFNIGESIARVLPEKITKYGQLPTWNLGRQTLLFIGEVMSREKNLPLTLEQSHRVQKINSNLGLLAELPFTREMKKEISTLMVDDKIDVEEATQKFLLTKENIFGKIPKNFEPILVNLVSEKNLPFNAAFLQARIEQEDRHKLNWKDPYQDITQDDEECSILLTLEKVAEYVGYPLPPILNRRAFLERVKEHRQKTQKMIGEELSLLQATCTVLDYYIKHNNFEEATYEALSNTPKKTLNVFNILDYMTQQQFSPHIIDVKAEKMDLERQKQVTWFILNQQDVQENEVYLWPVETLSKLYRQAHHLIPDQVVESQEVFQEDVKRKMQEKEEQINYAFARWLQFHDIYHEDNWTPRRVVSNFGEQGHLIDYDTAIELDVPGIEHPSWRYDPRNPRYKDSVEKGIEEFNRAQLNPDGISFLLNVNMLRSNPFLKTSKIDEEIPEEVKDEEYRHIRESLFQQIDECEEDEIPNKAQIKNAIGKWFGWGGLDNALYHNREEDMPHPEGQKFYRKRIKFASKLFNPLKIEKETLVSRFLLLEKAAECIDASREVLDTFEGWICGEKELNLHQRISFILANWLKFELGEEGIKEARRRQSRGLEPEFSLFVRLACAKHLGLPSVEESMSNHGTLQFNPDHLSISVTNALKLFRSNLIGITYDSLQSGHKRSKAQSTQTYLDDWRDWMKNHPNYCNVVDETTLLEFPKGKVAKVIPTKRSMEPIIVDFLEDYGLIQKKY